jgi:hypothetical protein
MYLEVIQPTLKPNQPLQYQYRPPLTHCETMTMISIGLFKEASETVSRIGALNHRVNTFVDQTTPDVITILTEVKASTFYQSSVAASTAASGKAWRRADMVSGSLLSPSTQPASITSFRASVNPPPRVHQLDELAKKDCLKTYSDPQFFLEKVCHLCHCKLGISYLTSHFFFSYDIVVNSRKRATSRIIGSKSCPSSRKEEEQR